MSNNHAKDLNIIRSTLNRLNQQEADQVLDILSEIIAQGSHHKLDDMIRHDYDEMPVDIRTFMNHPDYMGKAIEVLPFWQDKLVDIFEGEREISEVACIAGSTRIPTLDGKNRTIKELSKMYINGNLKDIYTYTYDLTQEQIVPAPCIKAWKTGRKMLYEIKLDNGKSFKCTSDHKILTRDKEWKCIDTGLKVGDSLMPFNRYTDDKGYEVLHQPKSDPAQSYNILTYRAVAHWKYGDFLYRKDRDGENKSIHHKDFSKSNNNPGNLLLLGHQKHFLYHSRKQKDMSRANPHYKDICRKNLKRFQDALKAGDPDAIQKHKSHSKKGSDQRWKDPNQRVEASERLQRRNKDQIFLDKIRLGQEEFWSQDENKAAYRERTIEYNKEYHPKLRKDIQLDNIGELSGIALSIKDLALRFNCSREAIYKRINKIPDFQFCKLPTGEEPNRILKGAISDANKIYRDKGDIKDSIWEENKPPTRPHWNKLLEHFRGDEEHLIQTILNYNHKIVSIVQLREENVYNLTVDHPDHNYGTSDEICIRNSTGAIGLGKTFFASVGLAYIMHRLMCLKSPQTYYNLSASSEITIALMNIDMNAVYEVCFKSLNGMLINSPWFLERGMISGLKERIYNPPKNIKIRIGSKKEHFIGANVFAGLMDELNFMKGQSTSLESSKILKFYSGLKSRMESRFVKMGKIPGKLFMASSKNTEFDFLELYIQKMKTNPRFYLIDEPIWNVKPERFSPERFFIAVGNKYMPSKIIDKEENPQDYEAQGYKVISVPESTRDKIIDMNTFLTEQAGVSLSVNEGFLSYAIIEPLLNDNPRLLRVDNLSISLYQEDHILDYLNRDYTNQDKMKSHPHFIHLDLSANHDSTGISMVHIRGMDMVDRYDKGQIIRAKDLFYGVDFVAELFSKGGQDIPYAKIRDFIYYLRGIGYNIKGVSADSYQSRDMLQQLKINRFETATISLDRTDEGYLLFKNVLIEKRTSVPRIKKLLDEMISLERDRLLHKVDHPPDGCFVGETLICVEVYGIRKEITLRELTALGNNDQIKVLAFSSDDSQSLYTPYCNARITKYVDALIEVRLEGGIKFRCTPTHPILYYHRELQSYAYREAQSLCKGSYFVGIENGLPIERTVSLLQKIKLQNPIPVYDIEVPHYHNFILGEKHGNAVVHNSKDMSDALCGAIWNASNYKEASDMVYNGMDARFLAEIFQSQVGSKSLSDDWLYQREANRQGNKGVIAEDTPLQPIKVEQTVIADPSQQDIKTIQPYAEKPEESSLERFYEDLAREELEKQYNNPYF